MQNLVDKSPGDEGGMKFESKSKNLIDKEI